MRAGDQGPEVPWAVKAKAARADREIPPAAELLGARQREMLPAGEESQNRKYGGNLPFLHRRPGGIDILIGMRTGTMTGMMRMRTGKTTIGMMMKMREWTLSRS